MSSKDLWQQLNKAGRETDAAVCEMKRICESTGRLRKVAEYTPQILEKLDKDFSERTSLTKKDYAFLFIAIGLQLARQYIVTKFPEPVDDQTAADDTWGHGEEHSNRHHQYYNPSLQEIITNPVPFDANLMANGALSGGGEMGHRVTAIGHDPIVGLIVGTANIATSTLTTWAFDSYHIRTAMGRDCFAEHAKTSMIFKRTFEKAFYSGLEGKKIIAVSLAKEVIHLRSDLDTVYSLPVPFVSLNDPKISSYLGTVCGMNMRNLMNIGKQAAYAEFINFIISLIHLLFYNRDNDGDIELYHVRTRKIILYSNAVASMTNTLYVSLTKDFKSLDIGGIAVAIAKLITDVSFIRKVKCDFVFGEYDKLLRGC